MTTARKELLTRINIYIMMISGTLTVILAIVAAIIKPDTPIPHIVFGAIFALACIRHIIMKRKSMMKYLKGE